MNYKADDADVNIPNNNPEPTSQGESAEPVRIKYVTPQVESTPEENARLLGEFANIILQIGFRTLYLKEEGI